ncbi:MAG: DUF167 domain-containing protein [Patescibacteria group bacterium]|nr:DUF167 domain-containing protein [Patescibacteria group bacterium]
MKINVKVFTKSSRNKVEYDKEKDFYKIKVTVVPEKGKANEKVIELLADYFRVSKSQIYIIKGKNSSNKIVVIAGE